MVIWLLTIITPLAVSARRGWSPGVVICFLLWIIGLTDNLAAAESDARRWQAAPWDAHPNAEAHALFGRAVAEAVEKKVCQSWRGETITP